MNLHHFFSVQDDYEHDFDKQEGFLFYHTVAIESDLLVHRNLVFFPTLLSATLILDYSVDTNSGELAFVNAVTSMDVDKENGDVITPCPFCGCAVEKMDKTPIISEEETIIYTHRCPFTQESMEQILHEIDSLEMLRMGMFQDLVNDGTIRVEKQNGLYGFLEQGKFYAVVEGQVYHTHYDAKQIDCGYCSCQEPIIAKESKVVYQLCPVLTAESENIQRILQETIDSKS